MKIVCDFPQPLHHLSVILSSVL